MNKKIIVLVIIILIILYIYFTRKREPPPPFEIVVARYNEDLSFLKNAPFNEFPVICYNKGPVDSGCRAAGTCKKMIKLPNVGKCDHTYLYHIIQNYHNLADVTFFIPGSCLMNSFKTSKTMRTFEYAKKTKNSVFIGLNLDNVAKDLYEFEIDEYVTTNRENVKINSDGSMKRCEIRPFGKWYESNFGDLKITLADFTSIFAVSREHILQHPRSHYEKLISYLDDDVSPECGHYMERSWVAVFSPIPNECLYNSDG